MLQSVDFFSLKELIHIFANIFRSAQTLLVGTQAARTQSRVCVFFEREANRGHVTCVLAVTLTGGRERQTKSAEADHFE